MDKEDFYHWEKMALSGIIGLMVKYFGFTSVKMEYRERDNVESGVWIELEIEKERNELCPKRYIHGQRTDIVRRRLIEFLDELDIRKEYKRENDDPNT